jgi:hypothetical protein
MKPTKDLLSTLKGELDFLDRGGYRAAVGHRQPLFCMETGADWKLPAFFEESPSCPKERYDTCNFKHSCVLLAFVPKEKRSETVPCRHVPLTETGDTIDTLEKSGHREQIEQALRTWLLKSIEELELAHGDKA